MTFDLVQVGASSVAGGRTLVRPCGFPRGRHQDASNSASTTNVSRHEHPSRLHLRRPSAERRGKTRRRSPSGSPCDWQFAGPRATPDHLAVIQPPTATRLTARRWLRVDRPCHLWMGSLARTRGASPVGAGESAVAYSAERRSVGPSPLTSLFLAARSRCKSTLCQPLVLVRVSDTSMSTDAPEPGDAFHHKRPHRPLFRGADVERLPRWPAEASPSHVIIDVEDIDQTPHRPALTGWLGAACAPAASADSCSPRARPRTARTSRPPGVRSGRLLRIRVTPDRGQSPNGLEVRG